MEYPTVSEVGMTLILGSFCIVVELFRAIGARMLQFPSWGCSVFRGIVSSPAVGRERLLVQHAIAGGSTALEKIIATDAARLYRRTFPMLLNKEDAEDALQETWFKAYAKLEAFEGRPSLSAWLPRIVVNSALMIRRRKNVRAEASLDEILETQPERFRHGIVDAGPNPEQICAIAEMKGLVDEQIRLLPPGHRAAFQLCDLQGHSVADAI